MKKAKLYYGLPNTMLNVHYKINRYMEEFKHPCFINAAEYRRLDRYFWMGATKETDVILIYNCQSDLNYERFNSAISEGVIVEVRGEKPFTIHPQLIFSTCNEILDNRGIIHPSRKKFTSFTESFNRRFDVITVFDNETLRKFLNDESYIDVDKYKSKMSYKCRTECIKDISTIINHFGNLIISCKINFLEGDATLPDREFEFVSRLDLISLKNEIRFLEDCHVAEETLQLLENYTGERLPLSF